MPTAATSTPRVLADTGLGLEAISRAAADGKYLFALFWNIDNEQTAAMRKVFEDATAKVADRAMAVSIRVGDPAVILADEPTGNLDPETGRQVIGYFEEFHQEGKTIVMVTHDPRGECELERRGRVLQVAKSQGGFGLPSAHRGGVGGCVPRKYHHHLRGSP